MSRPETFQHAVMHLVKYVGELATIAEKLDHADEQDAAMGLARVYLTKRVTKQHMEVCYDAAIEHLAKLYDGETTHTPTQGAPT